MSTTSKMKTTSLINEHDLKNEHNLKNEGDLKNWPSPKSYFAPPPPLKKLPEIFLMTSHLDSHMTTDVKPDMLSGVQTGNGIPHDRYNIRGIAHQIRSDGPPSIRTHYFLFIRYEAKSLIKVPLMPI